MKAHIVIPPAKKAVDRIYGCNYAFFLQHNVILLGLAALLRDSGIDVEITDCLVERVPSVDEIADLMTASI